MKRSPSSVCWMTERRLSPHPGCGNRAGLRSTSRMNHPRKNAPRSAARPDARFGCIALRVAARAKCPYHRCARVAAFTAVARCSLTWPPTESAPAPALEPAAHSPIGGFVCISRERRSRVCSIRVAASSGQSAVRVTVALPSASFVRMVLTPCLYWRAPSARRTHGSCGRARWKCWGWRPDGPTSVPRS